MLEYTVRVAGIDARAVHAISLSRDSASGGGVVSRLSQVGVLAPRGSVRLSEAERSDLAAGTLWLTVFVEGRRIPVRARVQSN